MTAISFDFAVLGDSQPEGLLVASGLVRKGFSVALVPSALLDELPGDELLPTLYPPHAGSRKLDDLLFRAGFFRLEDSGLVSEPLSWQFVFPKHRLSFEGALDEWRGEFEREFPGVAANLEKGFQQIKKNAFAKPSVKRFAQEMIELERMDPHFSKWLKTSVEAILQPAKKHSETSTSWWRPLQAWIEVLSGHSGKVYRVDPKLKTPYASFLVEHARKWGVQVQRDPIELKAGWAQFQISKEHKARHIILNSVGARRAFGKIKSQGLSQSFESWLYLDRVEIPLSRCRTLKEFCYLDGGRILHTKRDPLRDEALLTLGTWIPFEDSKLWMSRIEKGRAALRKLIPFMPETVFRSMPTLLELTEMRGECVRRGQIERLQPAESASSSRQSFMRWISRSKGGQAEIARRVYSLIPHDLPYRNRMSSFAMALGLLDHFDQKRKGLRPQAFF